MEQYHYLFPVFKLENFSYELTLHHYRYEQVNVTYLRYFGTTRSFQAAPIPQIKKSTYVKNKSTVQMQHFSKIYLTEILIKFPSCLPLMVVYLTNYNKNLQSPSKANCLGKACAFKSSHQHWHFLTQCTANLKHQTPWTRQKWWKIFCPLWWWWLMLKIFSTDQYIFHGIIMSEIIYIYTRIVHQRMSFSFHEHFQIQTATVPPKNI